MVRELQRNKHYDKTSGTYYYEPLNAQHQAEIRKECAWKAKQTLKSKRIYSYVTGRLKLGWSPEVICGRLKYVDYPDDPVLRICHETIYQWIYKKENIKLEHPWYEYLRRKQKKRRRKGGRKTHRVRITDRVSIHDRPKVIDKRKQFGHWEGDSIVGKGHISGLHTEYERVSSLIRFERLNRITGDEVKKAVIKIFGILPAHARRSITLDNGLEHVKHTEFGIQTYFADPYSAYQRGGNENSNLWIRYYFPKGTDFRTITEEELRDVEYDLNSRPRKRLGYLTPLEVFNLYITRCNRN